jgi:hypothetical protein
VAYRSTVRNGSWAKARDARMRCKPFDGADRQLGETRAASAISGGNIAAPSTER